MPDAAAEALRDLVRAREVTKQDQLRARHRVGKFLLRHGRQRPDGLRAWTLKHAQWLAQQRFELSTLQVVYDEYRATLAVLADRVARLEHAIVSEVGTLRRVGRRTAPTALQVNNLAAPAVAGPTSAPP